MKQALMTAGALALSVAPRPGILTGANGKQIKADFSFLTGASVLFDAVYVPGGDASITALKNEPEPRIFLSEAYTHCKAIAASGAGVELLESSGVVVPADDAETPSSRAQAGILANRDANVAKLGADFIKAIARHRHWEREPAV